jgi:hypothetical protein
VHAVNGRGTPPSNGRGKGNGSAQIFAPPTPLPDEPGRPPTAIEPEQTLIGAVLFDNRLYPHLANVVTAEAFSEGSYACAWSEIDRKIGQRTVVGQTITALPSPETCPVLWRSPPWARGCRSYPA